MTSDRPPPASPRSPGGPPPGVAARASPCLVVLPGLTAVLGLRPAGRSTRWRRRAPPRPSLAISLGGATLRGGDVHLQVTVGHVAAPVPVHFLVDGREVAVRKLDAGTHEVILADAAPTGSETAVVSALLGDGVEAGRAPTASATGSIPGWLSIVPAAAGHRPGAALQGRPGVALPRRLQRCPDPGRLAPDLRLRPLDRHLHRSVAGQSRPRQDPHLLDPAGRHGRRDLEERRHPRHRRAADLVRVDRAPRPARHLDHGRGDLLRRLRQHPDRRLHHAADHRPPPGQPGEARLHRRLDRGAGGERGADLHLDRLRDRPDRHRLHRPGAPLQPLHHLRRHHPVPLLPALRPGARLRHRLDRQGLRADAPGRAPGAQDRRPAGRR